MKKNDLQRLHQLELKWRSREHFSAHETHEFVRLFKERIQEYIDGKC